MAKGVALAGGGSTQIGDGQVGQCAAGKLQFDILVSADVTLQLAPARRLQPPACCLGPLVYCKGLTPCAGTLRTRFC